MKVALVDINKENLELAKKSVGERTSIFQMDVGNIKDWETLKKDMGSDFGTQLHGTQLEQLTNSQYPQVVSIYLP